MRQSMSREQFAERVARKRAAGYHADLVHHTDTHEWAVRINVGTKHAPNYLYEIDGHDGTFHYA